MLHNWCCVEGQKVRGWAEHCELEVREGILEEVLPGQTETAQSLLTWLLQVPDYCSMCGGEGGWATTRADSDSHQLETETWREGPWMQWGSC